MRRWSSCCGWRSATPVDKRARERDKEKGLPPAKRKAKGKLVEPDLSQLRLGLCLWIVLVLVRAFWVCRVGH